MITPRCPPSLPPSPILPMYTYGRVGVTSRHHTQPRCFALCVTPGRLGPGGSPYERCTSILSLSLPGSSIFVSRGSTCFHRDRAGAVDIKCLQAISGVIGTHRRRARFAVITSPRRVAPPANAPRRLCECKYQTLLNSQILNVLHPRRRTRVCKTLPDLSHLREYLKTLLTDKHPLYGLLIVLLIL